MDAQTRAAQAAAENTARQQATFHEYEERQREVTMMRFHMFQKEEAKMCLNLEAQQQLVGDLSAKGEEEAEEKEPSIDEYDVEDDDSEVIASRGIVGAPAAITPLP